MPAANILPGTQVNAQGIALRDRGLLGVDSDEIGIQYIGGQVVLVHADGTTTPIGSGSVGIDLWTVQPGAVLFGTGASRMAGNSDMTGGIDSRFTMMSSYVRQLNLSFPGRGLSGVTFVNTAVGGQTSTAALLLLVNQIQTPITSNGATNLYFGMDWLVNDVDPGNNISNATSAANVVAILRGANAAKPGLPIWVLMDYAIGGTNPSERPDDVTALITKNNVVTAAIAAAPDLSNVRIVDSATAMREIQIRRNGPIVPFGQGARRGLFINEPGPHLSNAGQYFWGDAIMAATTLANGSTVLPKVWSPSNYGLRVDMPVWGQRFVQTCQRFSQVIDGFKYWTPSSTDAALAAARTNDAQYDGGGILSNGTARMLSDLVIWANPKTDPGGSQGVDNLWGCGQWATIGAPSGNNTAELGLSTWNATPDVVRFILDPVNHAASTHLFAQLALGAGGGTSPVIDMGAASIPDGNPHFYGLYFTGGQADAGLSNNSVYVTVDGFFAATKAISDLSSMGAGPMSPYVKGSAAVPVKLHAGMVGYRQPHPINY